jgi:hypothetical protein
VISFSILLVFQKVRKRFSLSKSCTLNVLPNDGEEALQQQWSALVARHMRAINGMRASKVRASRSVVWMGSWWSSSLNEVRAPRGKKFERFELNFGMFA